MSLISELSNLHTLSIQYCDELCQLDRIARLTKLAKLKLCRGYSFHTQDIVHLASTLNSITHLTLTECNRVCT